MSLDATNDNVVTADKRRAARRRVLLAGKLAHVHNSLSSDCRICSLSAGGAQILVSSNDSVTSDACLIVVRDGLVHQTRTVWAQGAKRGVEFTDTFSLTGAVPAHLQGMRRLWLEHLPR